MSYLGRGLDDIPGRPFGWAFHKEREEIRAHLRRRIWRFGFDRLAAARLEGRINEIQARLHKNRPTYKERCAARAATRPAYVPPEEFTREELERLAELFAGANDPITASIGEKARKML